MYHLQLWLPCCMLSLLKYVPLNGSGVVVTPIWPCPPQTQQTSKLHCTLLLCHQLSGVREAQRSCGISVCLVISLSLTPSSRFPWIHGSTDFSSHSFGNHALSLHMSHVFFSTHPLMLTRSGCFYILATTQCSVNTDVHLSPQCLHFLLFGHIQWWVTASCGTFLFNVCTEISLVFSMMEPPVLFHCYGSDFVGLFPMVSLLRYGGTLERCSLVCGEAFRVFMTSLKEAIDHDLFLFLFVLWLMM